MEHYLNGWKQFAQFSGRTGRKEFWIFILVNYAISLILSLGVGVISDSLGSILAAIWSLATIVPIIAIAVRRMNDIGKEWWYMLIPLYNIYLAIQPSEPGTNSHGPEPIEG